MTPDDPLRPASMTISELQRTYRLDYNYAAKLKTYLDAFYTAAFTAGQLHDHDRTFTVAERESLLHQVFTLKSQLADAQQEIFNLRGAFDIKARLVERAEALRAGQQPTPPADQEPL